MTAIQAGRKYILMRGRRAGQEVEVVKVLDDRFALVKGGKGKERKSSLKHLSPMAKK